MPDGGPSGTELTAESTTESTTEPSEPSTPVSTPASTSPAPPASTPARDRRRAETARLLLEAQSAEGEEKAALEDAAIRLNMGVAVEIARRYHGRGVGGDDLDQVAYLGLTKAVRGFDPTRGADFLSFAVPTIRGELRRYFRDFGWAVRPPRSVQELQGKLTAADGELSQRLGRSPRPSELAEHLGVELDLVLDSLAANGCFAPVSLDAPVGEGEMSPVDRLGGPDLSFGSAEARATLGPLLRTLTPREQRILEMRFFGGFTQAEIGREVGVTQMQVSRLLARLLTRLREQLEADAA